MWLQPGCNDVCRVDIDRLQYRWEKYDGNDLFVGLRELDGEVPKLHTAQWPWSGTACCGD